MCNVYVLYYCGLVTIIARNERDKGKLNDELDPHVFQVSTIIIVSCFHSLLFVNVLMLDVDGSYTCLMLTLYMVHCSGNLPAK